MRDGRSTGRIAPGRTSNAGPSRTAPTSAIASPAPASSHHQEPASRVATKTMSAPPARRTSATTVARACAASTLSTL